MIQKGLYEQLEHNLDGYQQLLYLTAQNIMERQHYIRYGKKYIEKDLMCYLEEKTVINDNEELYVVKMSKFLIYDIDSVDVIAGLVETLPGVYTEFYQDLIKPENRVQELNKILFDMARGNIGDDYMYDRMEEIRLRYNDGLEYLLLDKINNIWGVDEN